MRIANLHAKNDNSTAENQPDPREEAMTELGLTEAEKEKFRRAWKSQKNAKPSNDRDGSLDAERRLLTNGMLKSAPSAAIRMIKELVHREPARLHAVGKR